MDKYFIEIMNPENVDSQYYFDDCYFDDALLAIGGNRDFTEINEDLVFNIEKKISYCYEDIESAIRNTEDRDAMINEIEETIRYYFNGTSQLTNSQVNKLFKIVRQNGDQISTNSWYTDDLKIVCETLQVIHGEEFVLDQISGNCQSDWNKIIYAKSIGKETVDYYESIYFNTGLEVWVTQDKYDENNDVDMQAADTDLFYIPESYCYSEDKLIDYIIQQRSGGSRDEYKITNYDEYR